MRSLIAALIFAALLAFAILAAREAKSSMDVPPVPADMTQFNAAMATMSTKASEVPTSGPGPGLCRQTIVPSDLVTSGGVTGTAGTCSRILQCGTSSTYVVTQFNVGSGC